MSVAPLEQTSFRGACLWDVDFAHTDLSNANLSGAFYDRFTRWPPHFDPEARGLVFRDDWSLVEHWYETERP